MAYGAFVVQKDLTFSIDRGDIFVIMGGSGCGKSTLLRHLIGLQPPAAGKVYYGAESLWDAEPRERQAILRRVGMLYQSGALFTSMTLAENIALPLQEYTDLDARRIRAVASLEAGAGRPRRLRGLLPLADQRRHDEAGRARARHGARSRDTVLRRAFGGARSDHLEAARRSHPPAARRPGRDHRHGHARAAEHFRDRQQFGLISTTSSGRLPPRAIPRTWSAKARSRWCAIS